MHVRVVCTRHQALPPAVLSKDSLQDLCCIRYIIWYPGTLAACSAGLQPPPPSPVPEAEPLTFNVQLPNLDVAAFQACPLRCVLQLLQKTLQPILYTHVPFSPEDALACHTALVRCACKALLHPAQHVPDDHEVAMGISRTCSTAAQPAGGAVASINASICNAMLERNMQCNDSTMICNS